jgi:hypothetical protein
MILGGGTFGRWLDNDSEVIMNKISALLKEAPGNLFFPFTMWEGAIYESGSGPSLDVESAGTEILDVSDSRTMINKFLMLINYPVFDILLQPSEGTEQRALVY